MRFANFTINLKGALISVGLIAFMVLNPPPSLRGYDYSRETSETLQQQQEYGMEMESIKEVIHTLEQKVVGMTSQAHAERALQTKEEATRQEEIVKQLEKQQKHELDALKEVIHTLEKQLKEVSSKHDDLQTKEKAHNDETMKRLENQETKIQQWNDQQQQQSKKEDTATTERQHRKHHHKQAIQDDNYKGDIPKRIHLIYVSKGLGMRQLNETGFSANLELLDKPKRQSIPKSTLDIYEKWQQLHPNWEVTLWDDAKVRQWLIEQNQQDLLDHFSRIPIIAWMADVLRFVILEQLGGVYLDADILPLRNMDPLLEWMNDENEGGTSGRKGKGAFGVCQDERPLTMYEIPVEADPPTSDRYYDWSIENTCANCTCDVINNAVIGSKPHHPAVAMMREKGIAKSMKSLEDPVELGKIGLRHWKILKIAGPVAWDYTIKDQHRDNLSQVHALRTKPFFPCHYNDRRCRRNPDEFTPQYSQDAAIFGLHLYAKSWEQDRR